MNLGFHYHQSQESRRGGRDEAVGGSLERTPGFYKAVAFRYARIMDDVESNLAACTAAISRVPLPARTEGLGGLDKVMSTEVVD
ncbi:MAG: hypothetical protein LKK52_03405 [Bifidobacterium psychraerophilum]|nr:hypothetical protein [Bifidobacterium psychraerophilum]MCI2181762.1 hypothetical protein [Bifidobacterium psychraerophilum]